MPTVFEINGYRFFFYSNENNEPVHIHISKADAEAKYWVLPEISEAYSYNFKVNERREIKSLVKKMSIKSSNPGMNSSKNKKLEYEDQIVNKRSSDPFDKLIFEKGLRIKQIMMVKSLNTMVVLLNNAAVIRVPIDYFERLKNASQSDLDKWELSGNGTGIRWKEIDEDLSLKGLIKESALASVLHRLEGKRDASELSVL